MKTGDQFWLPDPIYDQLPPVQLYEGVPEKRQQQGDYWARRKADLRKPLPGQRSFEFMEENHVEEATHDRRRLFEMPNVQRGPKRPPSKPTD